MTACDSCLLRLQVHYSDERWYNAIGLLLLLLLPERSTVAVTEMKKICPLETNWSGSDENIGASLNFPRIKWIPKYQWPPSMHSSLSEWSDHANPSFILYCAVLVPCRFSNILYIERRQLVKVEKL